jgi:hypothetical protein
MMTKIRELLENSEEQNNGDAEGREARWVDDTVLDSIVEELGKLEVRALEELVEERGISAKEATASAEAIREALNENYGMKGIANNGSVTFITEETIGSAAPDKGAMTLCIASGDPLKNYAISCESGTELDALYGFRSGSIASNCVVDPCASQANPPAIMLNGIKIRPKEPCPNVEFSLAHHVLDTVQQHLHERRKERILEKVIKWKLPIDVVQNGQHEWLGAYKGEKIETSASAGDRPHDDGRSDWTDGNQSSEDSEMERAAIAARALPRRYTATTTNGRGRGKGRL